MQIQMLESLLMPFLGTALGSACVFLLHRCLDERVQQSLTGFAAGVMVAAGIWSLLIPAMENAAGMGAFAFLPAVVGFWLGIVFLLFLDHSVPHTHLTDTTEGPRAALAKDTMLTLAVTIHNVPEGMAVGVILAGWLAGKSGITAASVLTLSAGIAIQNFPEGAIISMPVRSSGAGKGKAFVMGVLSGAVEPIASLLTMLLAGLVVPLLPYFLSFAAGAMFYVVVEELVPEMAKPPQSDLGTVFFSVGFTLMMALDAALG